MQYEVRYQVAGDEFATTIDAEDAASAARLVQEQHQAGEDSFELIQVHLLEEPGDVPPSSPQTDNDLILS